MNNPYSQNKSFVPYTDGQKKTANPPYRTEEEKKKPAPYEILREISENAMGMLSEGARIKQDVGNVLTQNYPSRKYKGVFDSIDEKTIEKNIPLAESVIKKNEGNGAYKVTSQKKLPWLRDGMALFYAASESGNHKAANAARTAAYTEGTSADTSAQADTSNKRYVNAEIGLNVREAPGIDSRKIGILRYNDEVEFTGNKVGDSPKNMWAEIKYGDKTGWVFAKHLNLERPYETSGSNSAEPPKNENSNPEKNKEKAEDKSKSEPGTRYVGEKTIGMRATPGFRGHTKATIDYGQSVEYTGNSEILDGIKWAEVKHGGKTGWVIANSLTTGIPDPVIDKNVPEGMIVTQSMGSEDRTKLLNEKMPEWMMEKGSRSADPNMIEWYKNKGANVRYTGAYCLPIKSNVSRISQGFYGTTSHAGKYNSKDQKYIYETGHLGAVDIAAPMHTPVYSVLQGKVVYTAAPNTDYHRVTVETQINGETYYIEYLHFAKINVEVGQQLSMGTQVGTVGKFGKDPNDDTNGVHLDFRVYQFKEGYNNTFKQESSKQFFDPFEFFDFDIQYKPTLGIIDYN